MATVRGAMLFPIDDLLDATACYELLLSVLHPKGLRCPEGHELPADQAPHDRHRASVVDYRCRACGKVFNVFTGTALHGARFSPARLVMILRGFAQCVPTLHLAQEFDIGRRLVVLRVTAPGTAVHTDEGHAYDDPDDRRRTRFSVNHKRKEWARDDDEDGVREVHSNTIEGFWLGLRNDLRPFRGVSKWCLDLDLAFYEGIHNDRRDFLGFLRRLLGPFTPNSP